MRTLLLQLDASPAPSVFDRVVAYDHGADVVMSYGGVTPGAVRDLVHGCLFTRAPADLHHTAIFVGGADMALGERLFDAVQQAFFGPFRVSVMLDANGSNTTAAAAVLRLEHAVGPLQERRAVVVGSGPVGVRAAGLLSAAGARVTITTRHPLDGSLASGIVRTFGGHVVEARLAGLDDASSVLEGAELLLNAGPAGVTLVPESAWRGRSSLRAVVDLNAVPPAGVEGIAPPDKALVRDGITTFGALAVGSLKMKIHGRCIAALFERNDALFDAASILALGRSLG